MTLQMKNGSFGTTLSFKFLALGDSKIGKTSILERYVYNTFKENYLVTIGMDIRTKRLKINDKDIDIFISDTAGQERFHSISKMSYNGADGILIGFALNDPKTLKSINYWIDQIYKNKGKDSNVSLVLFGNKCDDKNNIKIKEDDITDVKLTYGLTYFETSAKEDINITDLFNYLIKMTIVNRGLMKEFGLNETSSIDEIIITERENETVFEYDNKIKKKKKKKKKKIC